MSDFDSKLASQCQGLASCLSYNAEHYEGEAKHTLIEASCRLDHHSCRAKKGPHGNVVVNARGKFRRLTIRERLAIWLLRGKLEIRP
jgi:hypothetical protein